MGRASISTVHEQFDWAVKQWADRPALKFVDQTLSYEQLSARANGTAEFLASQGVRSGDVVALYLDRSIETIVIMIALLKLGAAYLPIEKSNPIARIKYCLGVAGVRCLLHDGDREELTASVDTVIDVRGNAALLQSADQSPSAEVNMDAVAYIMFTSGSSGKPKGVMVPHRAITRLVINTNYIEFTEHDRVLQFSPLSFDASTLEVWGALLNGSLLVLYPDSMLDPNLFKQTINDNQINILWLTAALFHLIVDRYLGALAPVKTLLAGGDVLHPGAVKKVLATMPGVTVINGYGPTENTTFTCCHRMTVDNPPKETVPIGVAITNTQVYILDDSRQAVADGEVGELYAAGAGVALGYIDENKNSSAFFEDSTVADGLIYRTGDLVRKNPAGEIEFIGRADSQVKVRGYRVCLDEVRSALLEIEDIRDALVMVEKEKSGDQLLVAYMQIASDKTFNSDESRRILMKTLPGYMIPDKFVARSDLPINSNGKLDRKRIQQALD
ncbi:MAG: amino acid adenylation domain-containing protein [Wenzhouxiangellaceae bacterium]